MLLAHATVMFICGAVYIIAGDLPNAAQFLALAYIFLRMEEESDNNKE